MHSMFLLTGRWKRNRSLMCNLSHTFPLEHYTRYIIFGASEILFLVLV